MNIRPQFYNPSERERKKLTVKRISTRNDTISDGGYSIDLFRSISQLEIIALIG